MPLDRKRAGGYIKPTARFPHDLFHPQHARCRAGIVHPACPIIEMCAAAVATLAQALLPEGPLGERTAVPARLGAGCWRCKPGQSESSYSPLATSKQALS